MALVLRLDASLRSREPAAAAAELVRLLSDPCSPPALVNTCAVKLADAFGHGDRSRRAVIAGCLRSSAPLRPSRVLNRVLVVERIGAVLAENNPAARVLALQALHCILPLLLDHVEALQRVGRCLGSTDEAECSAAASALGAACEADSTCAHAVLAAHLLPALRLGSAVAGLSCPTQTRTLHKACPTQTRTQNPTQTPEPQACLRALCSVRVLKLK